MAADGSPWPGCPGTESGTRARALAGLEGEGAAGRSTAWPAAPGTCYPPVFAQRVGRGSRMLSVGPWAFRASGASCWGWQLLQGPVSRPLCTPLSQLPDRQVVIPPPPNVTPGAGRRLRWRARNTGKGPGSSVSCPFSPRREPGPRWQHPSTSKCPASCHPGPLATSRSIFWSSGQERTSSDTLAAFDETLVMI